MGVNFYRQCLEEALKDDSEYPDWLFQMHLGPPKTLEELDPETPQYWRVLWKHNTCGLAPSYLHFLWSTESAFFS
ncbi:unnamed protein product [Caretta caretta]